MHPFGHAPEPAAQDGAPRSVSIRRLTQLVDQLEQQSGDRVRLHAARCALNFRRSWIELAEALSELRASGAYQAWGYRDLMSYAAEELGIRAATVDKLLVSFTTLHKHAPARLSGEDEGAIPSYQALDYFARATGEPRASGRPPRDAPDEPPSGEVLDALHAAVFDEGCSVRRLRQQFDPLIRPRSPEEARRIALRRLSLAARRLVEQLDEVEDLDQPPPPNLQQLLEGIRTQAAELTEQLRDLSSQQESA